MQAVPDAALGSTGTKGTPSNAVVKANAVTPDTASTGQPQAALQSPAAESSSQPSLNIELLRGQRQLEQVPIDVPSIIFRPTGHASQHLPCVALSDTSI